MTDDAHNMSLLALLIQGVAHGLAVDGQTLIPCAIAFVPASQGAIQTGGRDPGYRGPVDETAWHHIMALFAAPPETPPRSLPATFARARQGLVPAPSRAPAPAG